VTDSVTDRVETASSLSRHSLTWVVGFFHLKYSTLFGPLSCDVLNWSPPCKWRPNKNERHDALCIYSLHLLPSKYCFLQLPVSITLSIISDIKFSAHHFNHDLKHFLIRILFTEGFLVALSFPLPPPPTLLPTFDIFLAICQLHPESQSTVCKTLKTLWLYGPKTVSTVTLVALEVQTKSVAIRMHSDTTCRYVTCNGSYFLIKSYRT